MRVLNRLSIRARITIGTLLLAAVFFAGVAVVVRHQVENILQDASFEVLKSDASPFETAIQQEPNDSVDHPGEGQLVAVIDPAGVTRTSTLPVGLASKLSLVDLDASVPQEIATGKVTYLVAVDTVESSTGDWTIVTARNQDTSELVLADLTTGLVVGLGVLTLLFGVVSWLLTGAALRPVTHLRRSADAIVASGSAELLPVGTATDEITDLATTLNRLIDDLRSSAARERQMVSDASHELRTPLAVLQTQLELLRTGDRGTFDADILAAERATARLARLVGSLLELSRLDAGQQSSVGDIEALVGEAGEAIDRARLSAMSDQVEIELTVPGSADGTVAMPELLYGRVLDNLLSNSLRAVHGVGRVTVTLTRTPSSLVTVVSDDGPGMSPEFLPHAFDRFSQEDDSRGSTHGSGLGLAIVAAAADAAGGTVTLENAHPAGLTVTITLPITGRAPDAS
jgi:signal transduction histidine kinase